MNYCQESANYCWKSANVTNNSLNVRDNSATFLNNSWNSRRRSATECHMPAVVADNSPKPNGSSANCHCKYPPFAPNSRNSTQLRRVSTRIAEAKPRPQGNIGQLLRTRGYFVSRSRGPHLTVKTAKTIIAGFLSNCSFRDAALR